MAVALDDYVEYGFKSSFPGPFRCSNGTMRMLVLKGDLKLITELIDRTLNTPAKGAVTYTPISNRVILMYGVSTVTSTLKPFDGYGSVREELATFWVPLWAPERRVATMVPFIIVDNPLSHLGGREIYGFAKALGKFETQGDRTVIHGYGGQLQKGSVAGWHPLLEIGPVDQPRGLKKDAPLAGGVRGLEAELARQVPHRGLANRGLCEKFMSSASQVFLKQIRDAEQQQKACYSRLVEAPTKVTSVKASVSGRKWHVEIHSLQSHPITTELGVTSQDVWGAIDLKNFQFDQGVGKLI